MRHNSEIGKYKDDLSTPALVVDLDLLDFNILRMAEACSELGCGIRPHAKSHKCIEIARRQCDAGALGACAATVAEMEYLASGGIEGLLLTSPVVDRGKVARLVTLAAEGRPISLAIGHEREARLVSEAASEAGVMLDVLLDLDVGDGRFGALPGPSALDLATTIDRLAGLRLRGIQAYSGLSAHVVGIEERRAHSLAAMSKAAEFRDVLGRAGLCIEIFSGASTGTYQLDVAGVGLTEVQAGSYIFMDTDYQRIGGPVGPFNDFSPSLRVIASVVSAARGDRVTIDAGIKAFATDTDALPEALGWPGLTYRVFGDEFGLLTAGSGASLPRLGDRLEFVVPHCDPTVNLYDRLYALRGDRVEEVWLIGARRELRQG